MPNDRRGVRCNGRPFFCYGDVACRILGDVFVSRLAGAVTLDSCRLGGRRGIPSVGVELIDPGLNEPNPYWEKPDKKKWPRVIVERYRPAHLCQCQAFGRETKVVEQAEHREEVERQYDCDFRSIWIEKKWHYCKGIEEWVNDRYPKERRPQPERRLGNRIKKCSERPEPGEETKNYEGIHGSQQHAMRP